MGLEEFLDDGDSSEDKNDDDEENSYQVTLNKNTRAKFEEEWGMSPLSAKKDESWITERVEDGWNVNDFASAWNSTPKTVLENFKDHIEKDNYSISEVPGVNSPNFNKQHARWYIQQNLKHKAGSGVIGDNSVSIESRFDELPEEFIDGIDAWDKYRERRECE